MIDPWCSLLLLTPIVDLSRPLAKRQRSCRRPPPVRNMSIVDAGPVEAAAAIPLMDRNTDKSLGQEVWRSIDGYGYSRRRPSRSSGAVSVSSPVSQSFPFVAGVLVKPLWRPPSTQHQGEMS